jgi:hypothetical protein
MFPRVPGFGSRIWMICVIRAFGWLTGARHAGVSADMPPDPLALRRYGEFGVTWPVPEETVWRILVQQVT